MKLLAIILILSCGSNVGFAAERDTAITENELVRRTQELYDAIVPGDQVPWKKYFADDSIFSDEKGRTMDKAKLIADITPMPAGYSGAIKLDMSRVGFMITSRFLVTTLTRLRRCLARTSV